MNTQIQRILVPVDFGASSERAMAIAIELAKRFEAELVLVHVYEIPAYVYSGMTFTVADLLTPIEQAAREHLDSQLADVKRELPRTTAVLRRGAPAAEILACIDSLHPDLVVMGTHGRQGVSHALLGSVAEKVVRLSPAPVLTARG